MSEPTSPADEAPWQRRFAARANNRAWTLAEKSSRTPEEDREMLDAAHASKHLWSTIGNAHHLAHAQLLLGQVHALLGNGRYAMLYAEAAHAYLTSQANAPWESAISYAVLANAAHCVGNLPLHEASCRTAIALMSEMPTPQDREILRATINVVPKPAGGDSLP